MFPELVGNANTLFHENGDVRLTFDSGLQRIERTYFCADTYATEAEAILIEGFQPDDLPGFNLYPVPEKRDVCPGIIEFPCVFYGALTNQREPKIRRSTVQTSIRMFGVYTNGNTLAPLSFEVLADVVTYHYALPASVRFRPSLPPKCTLENFQFLNPLVSVIGNTVRLISPDEDESTESRLSGNEWVSKGSLLTTFRVEDITETPFGKWKETTVSWRASVSQRVVLAV